MQSLRRMGSERRMRSEIERKCQPALHSGSGSTSIFAKKSVSGNCSYLDSSFQFQRLSLTLKGFA